MTDAAESLEMQRYLSARSAEQEDLDKMLVPFGVVRAVAERIKKELDGGRRVLLPSFAIDRLLALVEVEAAHHVKSR